jgi:hypothetical protein
MLLSLRVLIPRKGAVMHQGLVFGLVTSLVVAVVWGASEVRKRESAPTDPHVEENAPTLGARPASTQVSQAARTNSAAVRVSPTPDPFGLDAPAFQSDSTSEGPADALDVDPEPLRQQLIAKVARKALLMSIDQLREEISRESTTIRELEAAIELGKARQALDMLTKSHPETKAGKAAGHMLRSSPGSDSFGPTSPGAAPVFIPASSTDSFAPRRRT